MNREEIVYLIPYLLSLALSLGVFTYTWLHRSVRGARAYSWFVGGQTVTILGFLLELVSPGLDQKILWDKFQWLTDTFLVLIPFLIFCVQFSEYRLSRPRLTWGYWLSLPILFTLLLFTDNFHHLIYANPHLNAEFPFPDLQYDFTFVVYGYSLLFVYGANFYGISLLIRRALQPYNLHRRQFWTIAVGFLIPLTLSILALFNIRITPQRDISPFSLAIGNLVVAWGLFRYGLFDLVPIARERVLENLSDAIFVLDASNRVVDINRVARANIGKQSAEIIGRPVQEVFAQWPEVVEQVLGLDDATLEVSATVQGEARTYNLSISSMRDKNARLIGRAFVAHDITRRKLLEESYRQLSMDLEQRVRERTEELRRSTERLRELTRQLIAAQEAERKRIAQELHDELGQAMTAISLDLGGIEQALSPAASAELRERLSDARSLADEIDERISELALDLRPSLLDDLGLVPTLQWYLNRYSQRMGSEVIQEFQELDSRLPEEVETTLYRVIQESLTNIARHAQAGRVRLSLARSAAAVTVEIEDDGRGFDVDEALGSVTLLESAGLLGIRDRVSTLGGRAEFHSKPGHGTRIHIEIPLQG